MKLNKNTETLKITGTTAPKGAALGLNRYFKIGVVIAILALMWFLFIPSTDKAPRSNYYQVHVLDYYDAGTHISVNHLTYYTVESIHEFKWGFTLIKDSNLGNIWVRTQDIEAVRISQYYRGGN